MSVAPDIITADHRGSFDPQQAATLLDQSAQQARRQLEPFPPWLLTVRAVLVLAALGTVWRTVPLIVAWRQRRGVAGS